MARSSSLSAPWILISRSGSEGANRKVKGTLHLPERYGRARLRIAPVRADPAARRSRKRQAQADPEAEEGAEPAAY